MKNLWIPSVMLLFSHCSGYAQDLQPASCSDTTVHRPGFSKAVQLRQAMDRMTREGVPGIAMAVYTGEGGWGAASGYANIEDKTPMQTCHLQYLQSISKTYMAVAVLMLHEQGKIALDAPMTRYLPARYHRYVSNAGKITVRMLLNHTSGIPEYNFSPDYVTYLLQHPGHTFSPEDYLGFIEGKDPDFAPGSRYSYRNTNYLLLALMTDALTRDHARFMDENIFKPLGLGRTFYRHSPGYPHHPLTVSGYWDRYSDGTIENVSQMQLTNVASLTGDDGILTTPVEAVKFLKGLAEGRLLADSTLQLMQTWVKDRKGNPRYGLGLAYIDISGQQGFGHSGGGLGAGCELYYFPKKDLYVFFAINLGTVTDSPLHKGAGEVREEIYRILLE